MNDLREQRFGRAVAIIPIESIRTAAGKCKRMWLCICDCGSQFQAQGELLVRGAVLSCGCLHREIVRKRAIENPNQTCKTTHGMSRSKEYSRWMGMIERCSNPKAVGYSRYGGRGISVCDRWMTFENFYKDMGNIPTGCTLDRIDNNGNYEPVNCRWATRIQQGRNKRNNHVIEAYGKKMPASAWSELTGIPLPTIYGRSYRGLRGEKCVS